MRLRYPPGRAGTLGAALVSTLVLVGIVAASASAITFGDATITTTIKGYGTVTVSSGPAPNPACTSPASTPQSTSYTGCATVDGSAHENSGTCSPGGDPCTWSVTLEATAPSGWHFAGWSGDCSGTGACTQVVESRDCTNLPCDTEYSPVDVTASFVDDRAPTTTFGTAPTAGSVVYSDTQSETFTWSTNEDNEAPFFACKKDEGTFAGCSSGLTWSSIADGIHHFCVHATDPSGLQGGDQCRQWEQETNPTASISTHPPAASPSSSAAFTYASNKTMHPTDGSTLSYRCKLDSGSFTTCPASYTDLVDGQHTFQVEAVFMGALGGGAHTSAPAGYTWTVDTTPPETTIDTILTGPTTNTTPSFTFHSDDPGSTFECSIDTGTPSFAPCSGPGKTDSPSSPLAPGTYTFRVRASDALGNQDPTPATETFTVSAPPTPTVPSSSSAVAPPTVKKKCKRKRKHGRAAVASRKCKRKRR